MIVQITKRPFIFTTGQSSLFSALLNTKGFTGNFFNIRFLTNLASINNPVAWILRTGCYHGNQRKHYNTAK
jgi:hypothetical protein